MKILSLGTIFFKSLNILIYQFFSNEIENHFVSMAPRLLRQGAGNGETTSYLLPSSLLILRQAAQLLYVMKQR